MPSTLHKQNSVFKLVSSLLVLFVFSGHVLAQQSASETVRTGSSRDSTIPGGGSKTPTTQTVQGTNQSPLLLIKKNTATSTVTRGWAVGTQNADTTIKIPNRDGSSGQGSGETNVSISIKQNPTGSNVKNNQSALTQPSTIVISLPTCTGGQVIVGNVCACTGGSVWNGSACVPPVTCASIKPSDSSSSQACTAYYSSPAWSGNVITNTTWSCPTLYGAPVSAVAVDTSGCTPLTTCASRLPGDTMSSQTCAAYYGNPGYTGNVITRVTWSCPSIYGNPTSSTSVDTSACVLPPVTCVAGTSTSTTACTAPYVGGNKTTTTTTTCPSGQYGAPSTSSSVDTSGCVSCSSTAGSQSAACSAGFSGTRIRSTSTNSCTGAVTYGPWDNSSCVACESIPGFDSAACSAGFSGTRTRSASTNTCTGAVTYGPWDTSSCSPCDNVAGVDVASCGAGFDSSSTKTRSTSTNSCTGVTSYGPWDTSSCSSCSSSTSTETSACPFFGDRTRTVTTNTCGGTTYGAWDSSGCSCPGTSTSYGTCPAPQSGSTVITTTYSGASCTASTSTDTSGCTSCSNISSTEFDSCLSPYSGTRFRKVNTNSCTGVATYGTWDTSACVSNDPITYTTVDFFTFDNVDPSRCSFQVWIFGYKSGKKISETLQSNSPGYVENGTCILW